MTRDLLMAIAKLPAAHMIPLPRMMWTTPLVVPIMIPAMRTRHGVDSLTTSDACWNLSGVCGGEIPRKTS